MARIRNAGLDQTRLALLFATLGVAALAWWFVARSNGPLRARVASPRPAAAAPAAPKLRERHGGLDVTFFVAADTHLGFDTADRDSEAIISDPRGIEATNLSMIDHMNTLPGKPWPGDIGGTVGTPRGVLIAGDLTEDGGKVDWDMFEALYGPKGPLAYPVYEADGNHDRNRDWVVRNQIARRHGSRFYSFDFDDLHLLCLSEAPDDEGLAFLSKDLKTLAPDVPVVIYLHYPLSGTFADDNWFGRGDFRERFHLALQGHRVIGIFHGHRHSSGAYRWHGYDVYSVGSPKHGWWSFLAVHLTDQEMTVASWNYELSAFWWWHRKPLSTSEGKAPVREVVGTLPLPAGRTRPDVRLDLEDAGAAPTSLR